MWKGDFLAEGVARSQREFGVFVHAAAAFVGSALETWISIFPMAGMPHRSSCRGILDKDTCPVVRVGSKVPDYLSLVVETGFGLDFEAAHDDIENSKLSQLKRRKESQVTSILLIRMEEHGALYI